MRLICTIPEGGRENPHELSYYLTSQKIDNTCEETPSPDGATSSFRIWIYDEDQVEKATEIYREYKANPSDPRYRAHYEEVIRAQEEKYAKEMENQPTIKRPILRRRLLSPAPYGPVSIFVLLTVVSLFLLAQFQRNVLIPPKIQGVVQAPILAPVEKTLIYDYPTYFETRDELFKLYTPEEIEEKKPPSADARTLIQKLKQMPVWMGVYDRFVLHSRNQDYPVSYDGPLFEKIAEGQIWRLFTPTLLHFDLLHIFFNVLWFILLGNQIEYRLGWLRYVILILVTGIISNTAQYLMSGPFFMGLSGVVVGMAAFIWARQQKAPWEGYLLHRFTLMFLAIFVVGMFVLQLVFFFLQLFSKFELTIGIANTAHLTGAVVGYLLGRMRFFSITSKTKL